MKDSASNITVMEWLNNKDRAEAIVKDLEEQLSGNMNEQADQIVKMSTWGVIGERRVIITDRDAMFREIREILHKQVMPKMITFALGAAARITAAGGDTETEKIDISSIHTPAVQEQIDAVISKYTVKGDIIRAVMKGDNLSFANEGDRDFLTFKEYSNDVDYEPFDEAKRYEDYVSFCKEESLKYECIEV